MKWFNAPARYQVEKDSLHLDVAPGTDFWRITHYGFIRDNGHFYYQQEENDFVASVKVSGHYRELYDQAGLMIRIDEKNWIKTGIEYVNQVQQVSAVVTREFSDWSVVPVPNNAASIWLKLTRKNDFVEISYSFDNHSFLMLRLAYFPPKVPVQIGIMAAAPDGGGFPVVFKEFKVMPLEE
jgi:regulation of enolase protein 1 (concanavalin A-like superfamily)